MIISESKYSSIHYDQDTLILEWIWFNETERMTSADIKKELLTFKQVIDLSVCHKILLDTQSFRFVLDYELQDWIREHFGKALYHSTLQKIAVVKGRELLAQISLERIIYEQLPNFMEKKFFYNPYEAKEWLEDES